MATQFNDTTADHKWSTAANWSDGVPDAADAVTVNAAVTSLIIDAAASCLSFDATGTAGITVSGSAYLIVYGNIIFDASVTWTQTGAIYIDDDCTFTTAGVSIVSIDTFNVRYGAILTLAGELNLGTKTFRPRPYSSATTIITGNNTVTCGVLEAQSTGSLTLTLGTSVINCTGIALGLVTTLTVTTADHTINIAHVTHVHDNFGGASWGIVNLNLTPTAATIYNIDGNDATFVQFNVNHLASRTDTQLTLAHNITAGSMTVTGKDSTNTLQFNSSVPDTARTLTDTAGTNVFTNVRIKDMTAAGGAVWQALLTDGNVDDGGNTGWTWAAGGLSIPVAMHHYMNIRRAA